MSLEGAILRRTPVTVAPLATVRLLVVGDSMSLGALVVEGTQVTEWIEPTYIDLLRRELLSWHIEVDAAPLRRTADAAQLLPALLEKSRPDVVLLATGSNDLDIDWRRFVISGGSTVRSRTPEREYSRSLRSIASATIGVGGVLVVTDALAMSMQLRTPFLERVAGRALRSMVEAAGGQARADAMTQNHREITTALSRELGIHVAPFGTALEHVAAARVLGPDGTHPNAEGHRLMAAGVMPVLRAAAATVERRNGGA